MGGHDGTTWVDMEVVVVVIALKDEAAGSGPHRKFRAAQAAEMGRRRREDLRILTTRTNSQTANGVS